MTIDRRKITVWPGTGELIGANADNTVASDREQRDDAKRTYQRTIDAAPRRQVRHVWEELRVPWTARLSQSEDQKVAAPPPAKGKTTSEFSVEDEHLRSPSEEAVRQAVEGSISTRLPTAKAAKEDLQLRPTSSCGS